MPKLVQSYAKLDNATEHKNHKLHYLLFCKKDKTYEVGQNTIVV